MSKDKDIPDNLRARPFDDLMDMIEKKWSGLADKHEGEQEEPQISDEELFRDAMSRVREIKEFRDIPVGGSKTGPAFIPRKTDEKDDEILDEITSGKRSIDISATQEFVRWVNPDDRHFDITELHRGSYSVQDYIDLHGYTANEAEEEIEEYLKDAIRRGLSCIKIIHGRGLRSANGPVIKERLVNLLQGKFRKKIRAFVSARQCDGGLGAVYVVLKQK
ncbi:MAG: Smr/MutS family protein [Nitrospirota bacterium]|nr:MAG: Smr/MutS family protein [Nitrospirota bacterium]